MSTNPNYLGPFHNNFLLNLYQKLPLVNSLSLNQSETVFKIVLKDCILNLWFLNINRSMSEWICPKHQEKRRLVYIMTTYLRHHGLMSFISLNIPEREINLHSKYSTMHHFASFWKFFTDPPAALSLSRVGMVHKTYM